MNDYFFDEINGHLDPSSRLESGVFGSHIIVDGIRISIDNLPPCLKNNKNSINSCCQNCEYFSPKNCLLRFDSDFAADVFVIIKTIKTRKKLFQQRSRLVADLVFIELKKHGRPLHYSIISKIVVERNPTLNLQDHEVYQFMLMYPEIIERVDEGIYQARKLSIPTKT